MDVRIGDEVLVEKGGEIIPKVVGQHRSAGAFIEPLEYITAECGTALVREEEAGIVPKQSTCPPQVLGRIDILSAERPEHRRAGSRNRRCLFRRAGSDAGDLYALHARATEEWRESTVLYKTTVSTDEDELYIQRVHALAVWRYRNKGSVERHGMGKGRADTRSKRRPE